MKITWWVCRSCHGRFRSSNQVIKHLYEMHTQVVTKGDVHWIGRSTVGSLKAKAKTRRVAASADAELAAWRKRHIG